MLVFAQATYAEDFEGTKECIKTVSPHVDATVIVIDQTVTEDQKRWLEENKDKFNLHIVYHEFRDNLPEMRNVYLKEAKKLGADWLCVSDPDEVYTEKLAKKLKDFVQMAEVQGFNMLPIHVKDQFEAVEWLDELDLLKEVPGGYRETEYWKPLLFFKLYADTRYEGVGETKTVHETLVSSVPWKAKNLPKEYYYVHKKSALKIWRNAARNLFIGGGGDNVGGLNKYWTALRKICSELNIKTWEEFEAYLKKGEVDEKLKSWLRQALEAPPTRWGTETRETSKYYFALHPEEITDDIKRRIKEPPELTAEAELENYITKCYYQVLHRHPDEKGLKDYVKLISEGRIKREQLPLVLKTSLEYQEKIGPAVGMVEKVRVQIPVDVDVRITQDTFVRALMKSRAYWETIKPKLDIGEFIETFIGDKKAFQEWFYKNRDELTLDNLAEWIKEYGRSPNSVAVCIMGYHKALPMILESVDVCRAYADVDEIHVQGDNFTGEDIQILESRGCQVHIEPWKDHFSDYKNKCISHAKSKWVLILDHDEIPTPEMAKKLKEIVLKSKRGKTYNIVEFESINQTVDKSGTVIDENRGRGKPLLHVNVKDPYYGNPHIWLKPNYYPWKGTKVKLAYRHIKEEGIDVVRAIRNVFLGGGGDNVGEKNPLWVELRALTDELGVQTFKEFLSYLQKEDVDSRLKEWFEKAYVYPWHDNELKAFKDYYYKLHPRERIKKVDKEGKPPEIPF